jgi:hypothetical protein
MTSIASVNFQRATRHYIPEGINLPTYYIFEDNLLRIYCYEYLQIG